MSTDGIQTPTVDPLPRVVELMQLSSWPKAVKVVDALILNHRYQSRLNELPPGDIVERWQQLRGRIARQLPTRGLELTHADWQLLVKLLAAVVKRLSGPGWWAVETALTPISVQTLMWRIAEQTGTPEFAPSGEPPPNLELLVQFLSAARQLHPQAAKSR